jgi:formamidopyrimidine-DNA glycosylase
MEGDLWLVLHLMIAGRLHWRAPEAKLAGRQSLAAFDFPNGSLVLTEAGSKHRASLHVLMGEEGLHSVDPGGIEVFESDLASFRAALTIENRTLKRALTDPRILSGIGNAYSDEILHAAQLSPVTLTRKLDEHEWERLFAATRHTLGLWIDRLRVEAGNDFPEKVTAFRKGMAIHGRYGESCPRCGEKIQRIRYADNETNYCARCQTGGKLLADRSLSRLLGSDWPRTLEELEALKSPSKAPSKAFDIEPCLEPETARTANGPALSVRPPKDTTLRPLHVQAHRVGSDQSSSWLRRHFPRGAGPAKCQESAALQAIVPGAMPRRLGKALPSIAQQRG